MFDRRNQLLGQFFTSSGHSDWPADILFPRQCYNLILLLTGRRNPISCHYSYSDDYEERNHFRYCSDENQETIRRKVWTQQRSYHVVWTQQRSYHVLWSLLVNTSGRQTRVKEITLYHYTNEKTAWGDSVSFHHHSLLLALTECSCLLYQTTVWG